ncbi:MAG TPA: DUF3352 domain-containing protein [Acidimicrobiales bacterium]|nr:DUF3352 domain-containing protein [Acidimicrobiales bacterium]
MKRLVLAVVVAGSLLAGCGGIGPTNETARSAGITPPDVLAFVSLSLDPSVEQKRHLLSIADAFPKADVKEEFDETRDDMLRDLSDEAGLNYETQVKPVLGPEIALAVFPPAEKGGEPQAVAIIEIDDEEAAKKLVAAGTEGAAYRIVGDHLLATADGSGAGALFDRFETRSEGGGLSAKPEFERLTKELHGDRLLLGWVDLPRLMSLAEDATEGQELPFGGFDPWNSLGKASPAAFDLHAEDQAIVFEAVSAATGDATGSRPVITEGLPADLLGALTVFDLGKALGGAVESFTNELGDDAGTGDMADELGLDPKRDILSWWGGETVLAVGPVNEATGFPDAALIVEPSDRAAAEAGELKLIAAAEEATGPLTRHEVDGSRVHTISEATEGLQPAFGLLKDRFIFATSLEYFEQVATKDSAALSESAGYESVIDPDTSGATQAQLYLDIDKIREALERSFGMAEDEDYVADTKPNIEPLDRFGMRAARIGDLNRVRLEITVS